MKKISNNKITLDNHTQKLLIITTLRYMLGRSSYGVEWIQSFILKNKDLLTEDVKSLIYRDVNNYVKDSTDINNMGWVKFLKELSDD